MLGDLWYDLWRDLFFTYFTFGHSLRWAGRRNVPGTGPVLYIANHESYIDPILVAVASPRRLDFLARANLFHGIFGRFLSSLRTYPVDQVGFARQGIQAMIDLLRKGHAVLVFPEGQRSWDGVMQPFQPGIHLIIKKTKTPIVPCGIAGAFETLPRSRHPPIPGHSPLFFPPGKCTMAVSIGKPLDGARFAEMSREQALGKLFEEVKKQQELAEKIRRR
jgi:1-acyl-sn-glycerol-3-phosphate acyltransferase